MALIEREAAKAKVAETILGTSEFAEDMRQAFYNAIDAVPTVDPIKAAGGCYCRECKYWDEDGRCEPCENGLIREYTRPTDFCSYGEPMEAQDDG